MGSVCRAVLLSTLFLSPLLAQTPGSDDARIDELLANPSVTWEQAAWLVGRSMGTFDESVNPHEAAGRALAAGWCLPGTEPAATIGISEFAYLLARALDIPGGVLYSLFPGPRYAFRELVYRRILPPGLEPDSKLSGQEVLVYLQVAQGWKEARS